MQINLSPEQVKKGNIANLSGILKRLIRGFIFLLLILGSLWLILALNISASKHKLSKINAEWQATEPLLKESASLTQRKKELDDFLNFLKQYFKKSISWSEKLIALSNLVPEEIWFNEISVRKEVNEGQEKIFLDVLASVGYLKSDEDMLNKINNFIERIKKDTLFFQDFDNLSLFEITKATDKEKAMDFKLSLSLKPEH